MGAKFFHSQNLPLKLRGLAWYRHFECSWHNKSVLQPSWPCYFYRNLIIVVSSHRCIDKVRQFHWHMSYKLAAGISFQIRPMQLHIHHVVWLPCDHPRGNWVSLPKLESTQIYIALQTQSSISYNENLNEPWLWIHIECSGTKSELFSLLSYRESHTCFLLRTGSSLTIVLAHNYLIVNLWDLAPSCIHVMCKLPDQILYSRDV